MSIRWQAASRSPRWFAASPRHAPVLRNYPITPTRAPADIRDANRPAPIWRARRGARRFDGGLVVSQTARPPMEGPARLDRAPCAGVRGCNDPPMPSGSIAGATPTAVSTSPGTRVRRHGNAQQSAAAVLDGHEHLEQSECRGDRHEEITGDDRARVIA